MCGIIGIISNKPVCKDVVHGLRALEHRGIYSSGMISYHSRKKEFSFPIRAPGSATYVFDNIKLPNDNIAIGHTRYATSGNNQNRDIQPLFYARPGLALAHNGQIVNYSSLKKKLKKKLGYSFFTSNDVETLLFALSQNLKKYKFYEAKTTQEFVEKKLFPALYDMMDPKSEYSVIGAYSVIAIIADYGLLAFKDPHGVRPLCFGKKIIKNKNILQYGFASETTALHALKDFHSIKELEPGEAMFIDFNHKTYSQKIYQKQQKFCPFELIYFSQIDSNLFGQQVYDAREKLGLALAKQFHKLKNRIDVVMPIPKSPIPAAQALARKWNKDYGGIATIPSHSSTRAFQQPTPNHRKKTVDSKFLFIRSHIKGKKIGLVDDSIVRGDTSKGVIKKLFLLGAKEVHFFSTYPPYQHICPGGIDVSQKEELLMYNKNKQGARKHIGATTLNFLSLEAMLKAINLNLKTACLGCTKDKYPFNMSDYKNFQRLRRNNK